MLLTCVMSFILRMRKIKINCPGYRYLGTKFFWQDGVNQCASHLPWFEPLPTVTLPKFHRTFRFLEPSEAQNDIYLQPYRLINPFPPILTVTYSSIGSTGPCSRSDSAKYGTSSCQSTNQMQFKPPTPTTANHVTVEKITSRHNIIPVNPPTPAANPMSTTFPRS